ncbi:protein arginine kinase [Clostridium tetani]|uniref:Protein-arginine kinase n=1 Tax=Clostridium tetani TaxID=1513 RepID=A0ABY0ET06_CLOTA|nr:protein arginine kinase [Clostridium tetani]CDI50849.1 ATP:guanido phosphotransferase [Clostridium tetani 12124569]KHO32111.1 ATP:guanido phosphotransferase [Clostridium tetani]RXI39877.1 protein arginine kinase [Clostridium tetani]RXI58917.1 protein arginine kinase [Clostridium tetani]RXI67065.1 protein arginine kinase [Clostridium tetani]
MNNWIHTSVDNSDIVLSSRIRLARNLSNFAYPHKISIEEGRKIVETIEKVLQNEESKYKVYRLWEMDPLDRVTYLEKYLISSKLILNNEKGAFIKNEDETVSLMINEEDHIRLQCITNGFNLEEAYKCAEDLDDLIEENLDYAFHENLGYMTACPTNLGTGLRASVMIHLPALTMNREINKIFSGLTQIGMTIRGIYGEGSKAVGNLFQVSNQLTLGLNEEEIINNLKAVVYQIINQEKLAREKMMKMHKYRIEDKVYRALGILNSAVLLDSEECLKLLSYVRLGVEMDIIKDVSKKVLNELTISIQSAMIQGIFNSKLTEEARQLKRAELVKKKLKNSI